MTEAASRPPDRMRGIAAACALASAGAAMDAYAYLAHGGVFANAQTGNVVLFAIRLATGHPDEAVRHVPSFLAFCAGVVVSRIVGTQLKKRVLDARLLRLSAQCAALVLLALVVHRLPDAVVTAVLAFLAAFQISSYSHLEGASFNSAMTTGNLWNALSALTKALGGEGETEAGLRKAAVLGAVVVSFIGGAVVGAFITDRWQAAALPFIAALVGTAAWLIRDLPNPGATAREPAR